MPQAPLSDYAAALSLIVTLAIVLAMACMLCGCTVSLSLAMPNPIGRRLPWYMGGTKAVEDGNAAARLTWCPLVEASEVQEGGFSTIVQRLSSSSEENSPNNRRFPSNYHHNASAKNSKVRHPQQSWHHGATGGVQQGAQRRGNGTGSSPAKAAANAGAASVQAQAHTVFVPPSQAALVLVIACVITVWYWLLRAATLLAMRCA